MRVGASFIRMELEVINLDPEIEDTPTKSLFSNRRCKSSPAIKKPAHVGLAWSIWFAASCAICHLQSHTLCRIVDSLTMYNVTVGETWTQRRLRGRTPQSYCHLTQVAMCAAIAWRRDRMRRMFWDMKYAA